jgi:hypothetical protein
MATYDDMVQIAGAAFRIARFHVTVGQLLA